MAQIVVFTYEQIRKCPHLIVALEHYRRDGTCRCDDPNHAEMREWGYTWSRDCGRWM